MSKLMQYVSYYYKSGQGLLQIGAARLLQIGARVITNWGRYYKSGHLLQIGAEQKSHKQILYGNEKRITPRSCNCPDKGKCPLQGNCLTKVVIYKGIVTDIHQNTGTDIGVTENEWKGRSYVHTYNFTIRDKSSSTQMSKYVWSLKDKGITD